MQQSKRFEQLKVWVKRHVVKAFPIQFEIEMKHPQPDDINDGWYSKTITYCTTTRLKEIFTPLLKALGLPCDLRKFEVWVEMALIIQRRLKNNATDKERKMAFAQETLKFNSIFKGKLEQLAEKLGINLKFKRALFNRAQGYLERFLIQGTRLEVGFGCDRCDPEFSSANYIKKVGQFYGTFAIFDGDCKVVDLIDIATLEVELNASLDTLKAA